MKNIRMIALAAAAAASLFSSAAFAQNSSGDGIEGPAASAIRAQVKKERLGSVTDAKVFYGDLSGQGTKDALAVVYSAIPGGNGESIDVWVLRDRKGRRGDVRDGLRIRP